VSASYWLLELLKWVLEFSLLTKIS